MTKECLSCGEKDELKKLMLIELNYKDRWWMCAECLQNKNDEWTIAKEKFYEQRDTGNS